MAALSPASRIEPGLLRDVRLLLGLPAAVESWFWQDAGLSSRSSVAATLRADAAQAHRAAFDALDAEEQKAILARIHAWRGGLPGEIWFAEIQALPQPAREHLPHPEDADHADAFFAALGRRLRGVGGASAPSACCRGIGLSRHACGRGMRPTRNWVFTSNGFIERRFPTRPIRQLWLGTIRP